VRVCVSFLFNQSVNQKATQINIYNSFKLIIRNQINRLATLDFLGASKHYSPQTTEAKDEERN